MTKPLDSTLNELLASACLPTLPSVAARLLELTAQDDLELNEIIDLIAQDVALSARLLKIANSAFYNFPQKIGTINHAVSLLGINAVRNLVLSFTFLALGKDQGCRQFNLKRFWEYSLVCASAAMLIGTKAGYPQKAEIFTIGLLQNIGQLIFALTAPSRYGTLLEQLAKSKKEDHELRLEDEFLGTSHARMGSEVLRHWGLPGAITEAALHHHDPQGYPGDDSQQKFINKIAYLSDILAKIFFSNNPEHHHRLFEEKACHLLGLDTMHSRDIISGIHEEFDRAALYFGVTVTPLRSVSDIIHEANIRLSLLHLSYEEINRELVRSRQRLQELREQLAERNRLLERLANIDGLTEIDNHRSFQTVLQKELNRSNSNQTNLSLLLLDIDHFKQFNDNHGHRIGDFILKELCRVAKSTLRSYDLIARYGGEEFAVVLPDTDSEGALCVAHKLCSAIASHDFHDGLRCYQVTISIGAASIDPSSHRIDRNTLINRADNALYSAKRQGRNQVAQFDPQSHDLRFAM